jgi:hypothetical protein
LLGPLWKGSVMTRVFCPPCRLRFTRAAATHLTACPVCGEPPKVVEHAEQMLGMRLFTEDDVIDVMAIAAEAALPVPGPADGRS